MLVIHSVSMWFGALDESNYVASHLNMGNKFRSEMPKSDTLG